MKILIIGDTPLAFLVSKIIDENMARNTHMECIYISRDSETFYMPGLNALSSPASFKKRTVLRHGELRVQQVKGINLKENRVILEKEVLGYDFLFLDQTPSYTAEDVRLLAKSTRRLIVSAASEQKQGTSRDYRIGVRGQDAESWQLGLAVAGLIRQQQLRNVSLEVDMPIEESLSRFLEGSGLRHLSNRRRPGFIVSSPKNPIKSEQIRGLTLDINNRAVVGRHLTPPHHDNVVIVDDEMCSLHLLWKPDFVLAKRIVKNFELAIEGRQMVAIDFFEPSLLLSTTEERYLMLGKLTNKGLRAKAVSKIDRKFFDGLLARNL